MGGPSALATPKKTDIVQKLREQERRELEKAGAILARWGYRESDGRFPQAAKLVVKIAGESGAAPDEVVKTLKTRTLYTEENLLAWLVKEKRSWEEKLARNPKLRSTPKKTETFGEKVVDPIVGWIERKIIYSPEAIKERIARLDKDIGVSRRRVAILQKFELILNMGEPDLRDGARFIAGER